MRSNRPAAWGLVALGLLLVALNHAAGLGATTAVWIVGGACLVAGLIGLVQRD